MTTFKSTSITNADATPIVANTSGEGGRGHLRHVGDYLTTTATTTTGIIERLVRIPTTAKVKTVHIEGAAMTKGSFDLGLYYSDSTTDGTAVANQGAIVNSKSQMFAAAVSFASAVVRTDKTNANAAYAVDQRNKPIWKAAGLTTDPGGFFDVVATSTTTISVGGLLACEVGYVE